MSSRRKISPSGLSLFLKSPKAYYWRYVARVEPITQSVSTYDHDRICGTLWSEFVARFYAGATEEENGKQTLQDWLDKTDGWVPEKPKEKLTKALQTWGGLYYQTFSPEDGCRAPGQSEVFVENERFLGYLDGLSSDGVIHEVKSTSRSPMLMDQLWKVQNSIQVRTYAVLAKASGVCIEFAWKDPPYGLFRSPIVDISADDRECWEKGLNRLADTITALGDDPCNYQCNPDGCCLVTKNITSMCQYQVLCDIGLNETTSIAFKEKQNRR